MIRQPSRTPIEGSFNKTESDLVSLPNQYNICKERPHACAQSRPTNSGTAKRGSEEVDEAFATPTANGYYFTRVSYR